MWWFLACTPPDELVESAPEVVDSSRESVLESSPESQPESSPESQPEPDPESSPPDQVFDVIVVAGDSWSTGSVNPTIDELAARGVEAEVRWESTAIAGSQAKEWVANDEGKLTALTEAVTGADVLLLYLGGNDHNFGLLEGLGWGGVEALNDGIEEDLGELIAYVQGVEPDLHVVLVDYSYFHYEWFTLLYGLDLDVDSTLEYNQGITDLGARKLALARANERVHYVHNFGILQHTLGLKAEAPWSLPLQDFPAGFLDRPTWAPDYDPFPGGVRRSDIDPSVIPPESLPAPTEAFSDGIHPNDFGWAVLSDSLFDQGLQSLLAGEGWAPVE